jgi:hypothetical protein
MTLGYGSRGELGRRNFFGNVSASPFFTISGGFDPLGKGFNGGGQETSLQQPSMERHGTSNGPFVGIGLVLGCSKLGRRQEGAGAAFQGGMLLSQKKLSLLSGVETMFFAVSRAGLWGGCIIGTLVCGFRVREVG